MLVETLLQWESWLKSDRMERHHVKAAQHKHRYIMYMIKKIGRRAKGMGLKITKFHAIMHMASDILAFGVPMEVDTGSNESGHKETKVAAKLTQKKAKTFDKQTAERLDEIHLLALAKEEMKGRPLWTYAEGYDHDEGIMLPKKEDVAQLGGAKFTCFYEQAPSLTKHFPYASHDLEISCHSGNELFAKPHN